jgi:type I restriction enzyme M protein
MKQGSQDVIARQLANAKGYAQAKIGNVSQLNRGIGGANLLVSTNNSIPFLVISYVAEGTNATLGAIKDYIAESPSIGLLAFGSGSVPKWQFFRRDFKSNGFNAVSDIESYAKIGNDSVRYVRPGATVSANRKCAFPIDDSVSSILFECHSHLRDIDGLHPDEALDELCKLIYLKIYDEEASGITRPMGLQSNNFGSPEEFAACARSIYNEAIEKDAVFHELKIPGYRRSRGVFNSPIRLSSQCLARTLTQLESFSLIDSRNDIKGRAFQRVLDSATRNGMGQYFTPISVVDAIVSVIDPKIDETVIDPFCGSAHFLTGTIEHVRENGKHTEKQFIEFAFGRLHGIEKSERMVRIAMTDMRLHGDGHSNIRCTDALLEMSNYQDLRENAFDIVMTNPPFGSNLNEAAMATLGKFELARGRRAVPLEVIGLERSVELLRPGGRIAIVLPEGIFSGKHNSYIREWIERKLSVRIVWSLPVDAFVPFGASIKTSVLFARKARPGESKSKGNILFVSSDRIGYDRSGRPTNNGDIIECVNVCKNFINKEGW